jgi:acetyltransferase-like isoleucine patch superfamily enzyme
MLGWISQSPALMVSFHELVVRHLPGAHGHALRWQYWKKRLAHLGDDVLIDTGVYFQNPQYISIDANTWIDQNVIILAGLDAPDPRWPREKVREPDDARVTAGQVRIGKNVHIAPNCILSGIGGGILVSDDCNVAAHCKLYALSHHYRSIRDPANTEICFGPRVPPSAQCMIQGPIYLGHNSGIALNSVLLPGTTVEEESFALINSVLRGHYPRNSLIAGNPAKRIKERFAARPA